MTFNDDSMYVLQPLTPFSPSEFLLLLDTKGLFVMTSAMAMVSTRGLTAKYMKVSSLMVTSMAWELESFKTAIHISESTLMAIQMVWAFTRSQMGA